MKFEDLNIPLPGGIEVGFKGNMNGLSVVSCRLVHLLPGIHYSLSVIFYICKVQLFAHVDHPREYLPASL
jgi:hypothetical protein